MCLVLPSKCIREKDRDVARQLATETFVLMKNENRLLPLKKEGKVALIGPFLNDRKEIQGTWSFPGLPKKYSTILESFRKAVGKKCRTALCPWLWFRRWC